MVTTANDSILILLGALTAVLGVILYVWTSLALAALFRKVDEPGWQGWVPFLNFAALLRLGGFNPWWVLVALVPGLGQIAFAVLVIISAHRVGRGFGVGPGMTVLAALLFVVWASILGFGPAQWRGSAAPAYRAARPEATTPPWVFSPPMSEHPPIVSSPTGPVAVPPRPPAPAPDASVPPTESIRVAGRGAERPAETDPFARREPLVDFEPAPWAPPAAPSPFAPASSSAPAEVPPPPSAGPEQFVPPAEAPDAVAPPASAAPVAPVPVVSPPLTTPAPEVRDAPASPDDDSRWPSEIDDVSAISPSPFPSRAASDRPGVVPSLSDAEPPAPPAASRRTWDAVPAPVFAARGVAVDPDEFPELSGEVSAIIGAPVAGAPRAAQGAVPAQQRRAEADDDLDDADHTVVVARRRTAWQLVTPDGGAVPLTSDVVIIGRLPGADPRHPRAQLVPVDDRTRTISKTHALLELRSDVWHITDLHSTNGVVLTGFMGAEIELEPGSDAPAGERFLLGDAELRIERPGA